MRDGLFKFAPLPQAFKDAGDELNEDASWELQGPRLLARALLKEAREQLRPEVLAPIAKMLCQSQQAFFAAPDMRTIQLDGIALRPAEQIALDHFERMAGHCPRYEHLEAAVDVAMNDLLFAHRRTMDSYLVERREDKRDRILERYDSCMEKIEKKPYIQSILQGQNPILPRRDNSKLDIFTGVPALGDL